MEPLRIAYIAAGAGGMYCGNCLHDNTLAAALIAAKQDVLLLPTYTPIRTDEADVSTRKIFLGGLNVYLKQLSPWFRWMPRWLERWFDAPWLIRWATRFSVSMRAEELGALACSVLRGEHGNQAREIEELARYLAEEVQPEVVHLSNVLLVGLLPALRKRLDVPVFCTLSGEDLFLQQLKEPYTSQALALMRERAAGVTCFVALSRSYADRVAEMLQVDPAKFAVIPHGLDLAGHRLREPSPAGRPPRLGYLGRISPEKGVLELAESFVRLAHDGAVPGLELRLAGYLGAAERPYLQRIETLIRGAGLADRYAYVGEVDRAGKIEFMQGLDVFCMASIFPESKGMPILEALANGVPTAAADHGACAELIRETGGGLTWTPRDTADMDAVLRSLLTEPATARRLGEAGHAAIQARFRADLMAERTVALYQERRTRPARPTADSTAAPANVPVPAP